MLVPIGTVGEWLGGRGFELRTSSFAGTIDPLTSGKDYFRAITESLTLELSDSLELHHSQHEREKKTLKG